MQTQNDEIFIDPDIPAEQQIGFLRRQVVSARLDTFEVLKAKLGDDGIEIFKDILRQSYKRIMAMAQGVDFETLSEMAGYQDRMLGLKTRKDYGTQDEFQYTITNCPYLEECRSRGLDAEFCHIFEDVYAAEVSRHLGQFSEPARMCDGDQECVFQMRNTFGKQKRRFSGDPISRSPGRKPMS